jgi:hypothetical protein
MLHCLSSPCQHFHLHLWPTICLYNSAKQQAKQQQLSSAPHPLAPSFFSLASARPAYRYPALSPVKRCRQLVARHSRTVALSRASHILTDRELNSLAFNLRLYTYHTFTFTRPTSVSLTHLASSPLSLRLRPSAGHSSLHPAHRLHQLQPPSTLHLTTAEQPQAHHRCVAAP